MQIHRRIRELGVSQKNLDGAQIGPGFQHVGSQAMSQGLLVLLMICTQQRFVIGSIRSTASRLK